jgi:DNA-binding ferritin-like protein
MANNKERFETLYNETKESTDTLESKLLTFRKNPNRTVSASMYDKRYKELIENKNRFGNLISEIYKFKHTEKTQQVVVRINEIFSEISKKSEEV